MRAKLANGYASWISCRSPGITSSVTDGRAVSVIGVTVTYRTGASRRLAEQSRLFAGRVAGRYPLNRVVERGTSCALEVRANRSAERSARPGRYPRPPPAAARTTPSRRRAVAPLSSRCRRNAFGARLQAEQCGHVRAGGARAGLDQLAGLAPSRALSALSAGRVRFQPGQRRAAPDEAALALLGLDPPVLPQRRQRPDASAARPEIRPELVLSWAAAIPGEYSPDSIRRWISATTCAYSPQNTRTSWVSVRWTY